MRGPDDQAHDLFQLSLAGVPRAPGSPVADGAAEALPAPPARPDQQGFSSPVKHGHVTDNSAHGPGAV
jgi:hypothetical protein